MKVFYAVLLLFAFITNQPIDGQTFESSKRCDDRIHVKLELARVSKDSIGMCMEVFNGSDVPLYVVTDTIRSDSSSGPYLSVTAEVPSVVLVATQLFAPPQYNLYANATSAHLHLLTPGKKVLQRFSIPVPITTTEPPYNPFQKSAIIPIKEVKGVEAVVGIIPADEKVIAILDRKVDRTVTGLEFLNSAMSGPALFTAQQLCYSDIVKIPR